MASKRGFAAMTPETQRAIASVGGKAQGKGNNSGNFFHNRERARDAGRRGGMAKRRSKAADGTPHA
jgi:general stress protein YciG